LPVNKIKNCVVTCGENFCLIQDLTSKKLIGEDDLRLGVYSLKNSADGSVFAAIHKEEAVMWH